MFICQRTFRQKIGDAYYGGKFSEKGQLTAPLTAPLAAPLTAPHMPTSNLRLTKFQNKDTALFTS